MKVTYQRSKPYPTKNHGKKITPELLVVHTTEGGSKEWLDGLFRGAYGRGDGVNVSVHWCIYKDGSIVEYAPWRPGEAVACYHAGESRWNGRKSCNYWSIGYEIQHKWGDPYPEVQIEAIIYLNRTVKAAYPNIEYVTHEQIAWPRGRKSDPTLPWRTDVAGRVLADWHGIQEDDDMAVDKVGAATVKPELEKLVKAGIITKPEVHNIDDAASVGLLWTALGRVVDLIPKP